MGIESLVTVSGTSGGIDGSGPREAGLELGGAPAAALSDKLRAFVGGEVEDLALSR